MDLDEKFRSETPFLTQVRVFELISCPLNSEAHLSVSSDCFNGLLGGLEPFAGAFADRPPGYI